MVFTVGGAPIFLWLIGVAITRRILHPYQAGFTRYKLTTIQESAHLGWRSQPQKIAKHQWRVH